MMKRRLLFVVLLAHVGDVVAMRRNSGSFNLRSAEYLYDSDSDKENKLVSNPVDSSAEDYDLELSDLTQAFGGGAISFDESSYLDDSRAESRAAQESRATSNQSPVTVSTAVEEVRELSSMPSFASAANVDEDDDRFSVFISPTPRRVGVSPHFYTINSPAHRSLSNPETIIHEKLSSRSLSSSSRSVSQPGVRSVSFADELTLPLVSVGSKIENNEKKRSLDLVAEELEVQNYVPVVKDSLGKRSLLTVCAGQVDEGFLSKQKLAAKESKKRVFEHDENLENNIKFSRNYRDFNADSDTDSDL